MNSRMILFLKFLHYMWNADQMYPYEIVREILNDICICQFYQTHLFLGALMFVMVIEFQIKYT